MTAIGFSSRQWLCGDWWTANAGEQQVRLTSSKFGGVISLALTPPWALHCNLLDSKEGQQQFALELKGIRTKLGVVDLGPHASPNLTPPRGWLAVVRHTRQVRLDARSALTFPKSRLKQENRFLRDGGWVEVHEGSAPAWNEVHRLHVESRERKNLASREKQLRELLNRISPEPWTFAVVAKTAAGTCIASGGFVLLEDGTCVYSFGGQRRSSESGRASVAMLLAAMRHASSLGCTLFDFGGSQDPGVDQFYSEFGADVVKMTRWVKAPWWFSWLFPRTWRTWTRPTQHV